ncbi:MAG: hypothetical protein ACYDCK_07865 [Thermoplasmatota archaeon]
MISVFQIDLALSAVSLVLLLYLLYVYVRIYIEMKQRFTLGLIVFTLLLILKSLPPIGREGPFGFGGRFPHNNSTFMPSPNDGTPTLDLDFVWIRIIPQIIELGAVIVLVWLSRE